VVDAVDLPLVEDPGDLVVELAGRLQIVAEGLLDDDASPSADRRVAGALAASKAPLRARPAAPRRSTITPN
jgi:hypothetical protein